MKVRFRGVSAVGGHKRISAALDQPIGGESELWFEDRTGNIELVESADPFAIALLPIAAQLGVALEIDGPLSPSLVLHLDEVARCLELTTRAFPASRRCHPVDISATTLSERPLSDTRAAALTLSGGIDSTFSLARHRSLLPPSARLSVERAVFVHGFDIPLADETGFAEALRNVDRIADLAGTSLTVVATNYKLLGPDWILATGSASAAALVCASQGLGTGLHASGSPYDHQKVPWGSAPYLDHLFSSASFEIFHDGAAANRLDKVKALADWPEVIPHLKFCWEGERRSSNCGQCPKCVLTMLMFRLCNSPIPTFVTPPTPRTVEEVLRRMPRKPTPLLELRLVVDEARRQDLTPHWYRVGRRRLQEDQVRRALRPYVPGVVREMRRSR